MKHTERGTGGQGQVTTKGKGSYKKHTKNENRNPVKTVHVLEEGEGDAKGVPVAASCPTPLSPRARDQAHRPHA